MKSTGRSKPMAFIGYEYTIIMDTSNQLLAYYFQRPEMAQESKVSFFYHCLKNATFFTGSQVELLGL
jgi:hypothetical protein